MPVNQKELPLWRSMLYVPATSERFIQKAHERGADAIKIDLEDAVAPSEKPRARTLVRDVAVTVSKGGADVLVRINRPARMAVADLEASVWPEVMGLVLPKVDCADHVEYLTEIIDELEKNKRKMYAGSIGYFSADRNFDTCIALRTALIKNNKFYIQSGAGIVADSVPEKEYLETVNKAKALISSLN